jgi:fructosamine-3-kinase
MRALAAEIAAVAGGAPDRIERIDPVGGGDVAQALCVQWRGGGRCFAKLQPREPTGVLAAEAEGLAWLREAKAMRIPAVEALGETRSHQVLLLEWIEPGAPAPDHDEQLGRGLAALHRFGAPGFGFARDNYIAALPQPGAALEDWPSFYRERRLEPMLGRARAAGRIEASVEARFERLFGRLDELAGPAEPPARLHGDLWGGNALCDRAGAPVLIDPAVYGGHREIDLAMMSLFGGFSERVFAAYAEAHPLSPDWRERIPLYQLYPLLVHVNLFGPGYLGSLCAALDRYV